MNPVEDQLPPPPQPHRISTSCDRHPDEHFTGFCPSCLCERLVVLDKSAASSSSAATATAGRKSASSAIKSIFRSSNSNNNSNNAGERPSFRARPGSFLPELRRTKSFSSGKNDGGFGFAGIFEPQRKSCDVRGRSTLHSLFNQDDGNNKRTAAANSAKDGDSSSSRVAIGAGADQVEGKFSNSNGIVIEFNEEEEEECEPEVFFEDELVHREQVGSGEIEEIEDPITSSNSNSNPKLSSEEQLGEILEDLKPMKDHLDLDSQNKKAGGKDLKELAGSFWSAASVFSKKLRSWTRKNNKLKKHSGGRTVQVSKKSKAGRSCRETQSEIADYGYGRRSCDTDPRFSLDVGRMSLDYGRISIDAGRMSLDAARFSLDDPRYSFDEPRASWDGYLIGGVGGVGGIGGGGRPPTTFPRMPSMLSVVEGSPAPPPAPPEEPRRSINEDEGLPGGAAQTKDYYEDSSSSRRRKSLDRSSSIRKTAAAVVAEMEEMKPVASNAKVTPAAAESLRDYYSESFDSGFRDSASVIGTNGDRKGPKKTKSWRSWNIWGLIVRRGGNKDDDDDRYSRANGVERSYSESWQENRNGFRSNSSVSWRNAYAMGGPIGGSWRKTSVETNGNAKKKGNEFVLERNRSARYSPNDDNGLLRFYLTPMRGSRRGATAKAKPAAYSHTIARNMLRMY